MPKLQDLTGRKFGLLTVLRRVENKCNRSRWECMCDCGSLTVAYSNMLITGRHVSCGCLKAQRIGKLNYKHGQSNAIKRGKGTRLYESWKGMKARCYYLKHKDYKSYGGRGIIICEEWRGNYLSFYEWAIANGYKEGLTIDRKDSDGPYSPDNCRWTTMEVQNNNKSCVRKITANGETHTIAEWAKITGINKRLIAQRVDHGIPVDKIFLPARKAHKEKEAV